MAGDIMTEAELALLTASGLATVTQNMEIDTVVPAQIDDTLTIEGMAADAKAAGDAIRTNAAGVAGKVAKPAEEGTAGQILKTNGDGTTEWIDQITPTDAQVADAVSDWLDDHPEATTTVQDGSITKAKLISALADQIDDATDDVSELKSALLLLDDIPDTTQTLQRNAAGKVSGIVHTSTASGGGVVRTDTYTFGETSVVETRTLDTGESLTITVNKTTKETTLVYAAA